MQRAKKRQGLILVLGNYFNDMSRQSFKVFLLIVVFLCCFPVAKSDASLGWQILVKGLPPFLIDPVIKSFKPVVEDVFYSYKGSKFVLKSNAYYSALLKRVAEQVFFGYRVDVDVDLSNKTILLSFIPYKLIKWDVSLVYPDIDKDLRKLLQKDLFGVDDKILSLIQDIPLDAFDWAEPYVLAKIRHVISLKAPGFDIRAYVVLRAHKHIFRVKLVPKVPVVVAVDMDLLSKSFPTLLMREIREKVLGKTYILVGLPIKWIEFHKAKISDVLIRKVAAISQFKGWKVKPYIKLNPTKVAKVKVKVESARYRFNLWGSVWVGLKDKAPEVGVHFGRYFMITKGLEGEIYLESKTPVDEFNVINSLGFYFDIEDVVRLGLERNITDGISYATMGVELGWGLYFIVKYGENDESIVRFGKRLNEYISAELYYEYGDDIDEGENRFSVRFVGNL